MAIQQLQQYAPLYVSIGGTPQTEVDSVTVKGMSGAQLVETIMRDFAGVVKGAARIECVLKAKVPYMPTDQAGVGFHAAGIESGGTQLDWTMITSSNQNPSPNAPVYFVIGIGGVAGANGLHNGGTAQQLAFYGYILDYTVDYAVGKVAEVSFNCVGSFQLWA